MKLKRLLTFLLLLILSLKVIAQSDNPFESIGKKGKILTLTKGQYNETFDADSIQQIGSALINLRTMKIAKLLIDDENKKRLEGEKHSRFLSVDPLGSKFPMLTPYQYASNRPIDGKDLDGLEYISYIVDIYQYENGAAQQVINYKWFDDLQHNKYGELGQGVTYDIRVHTASGAAYQITPFFVSRQEKVPFTAGKVNADYGNYMGASSLYNVSSNISAKAFDNSKILSNSYSYDLPAVDFVDEQARKHDQGYDALDAKGQNSLLKDWSTTPVDYAAYNNWKTFVINAFTGQYKDGKDPFNNQPITDAEVGAAQRGMALFEHVLNDKIFGISNFMKRNFSSQATNNDESNYNLFLKTYMHQKDDGTWERNKGMWTKQKDEIYTPNAPTSSSN